MLAENLKRRTKLRGPRGVLLRRGDAQRWYGVAIGKKALQAVGKRGSLGVVLALTMGVVHSSLPAVAQAASTASQATDLFKRGDQAFNEGRWQEALNDFSKCIHARTDWPAAWVKRAEARRQLGDVAGALQDLDRARDLFAHHKDLRTAEKLSHWIAALHAHEHATWPDVVSATTASLRLDPNFLNAFMLRSHAQAMLGLESEARQDLESVSKLSLKAGSLSLYEAATLQRRTLPARVDFGRGERAASASTWPEAIQAYTQAVTSDPEYALAYYRRAEAYRTTGAYLESMADAHQAAWLYEQQKDSAHAARATALKAAVHTLKVQKDEEAHRAREEARRAEEQRLAEEARKRELAFQKEQAERQNSLNQAVAAFSLLTSMANSGSGHHHHGHRDEFYVRMVGDSLRVQWHGKDEFVCARPSSYRVGRSIIAFVDMNNLRVWHRGSKRLLQYPAPKHYEVQGDVVTWYQERSTFPSTWHP